MSDNSSNNKRIARNTAFLYIRMLFVLVVSLYTSRVILSTLGVEDYGVYNVVAGFVAMFGFLNSTLSASMQRFYNYEGTKQGEIGYTKVYSTGFYIHVALSAVLLVVLESFGLWYVNNIMVVDPSRLMAANLLYQFSIASMILVVMGIPYIGVIMAKERMDFYAIVSIVAVVLKLAIVVILPYMPCDKLIIYGILLLSISIINFLFYVIYSLKNFKFLNLKEGIDRTIFNSLLSFSGWNLIGTFAFMLKGQGLNMLLNVFFGPVINAARGIAYQINSAITGFSANISTAFRPQIVNAYADQNYDRARKMMFVESKVCFALLLLLAVPIALEIDYLLRIWLGDIVPQHTNTFAVLVLIDSVVCTLNTPCTQVVFATGKLKNYQIASTIVNLCLLPACWLFLMLGFEANMVFILTIVFSIINQTVCLIYTNKVFSVGIATYIKEVCLPCVLAFFFLPIIPYLVHSCLTEGFVRMVVVGFVDLLVGAVITYYVLLGEPERQFVKSFIWIRIKKY